MPNQSTVPAAEITEILKRLFYLRGRLRVNVPEDMVLLKRRLDESPLREKAEGLHKSDFYSAIGVVFLHQAEPITMGELSRTLGVPLSSATRIVDWLVKHDYAQRVSDPDDRRVVRVMLTDTGQEMFQTINAFLLDRVEELLRPFTAKERKDLTALLQKLAEAMEAERNLE